MDVYKNKQGTDCEKRVSHLRSWSSEDADERSTVFRRRWCAAREQHGSSSAASWRLDRDVAHLADQDNIRRLPQRRRAICQREVSCAPHLALMTGRLDVLWHVPNGIFDGVAVVRVVVTDQIDDAPESSIAEPVGRVTSPEAVLQLRDVRQLPGIPSFSSRRDPSGKTRRTMVTCTRCTMKTFNRIARLIGIESRRGRTGRSSSAFRVAPAPQSSAWRSSPVDTA